MGNTLLPGHYLGFGCIERQAATFSVALRRATVPPDQVAEHCHEGAHLVLAIYGGYLSAAQPTKALAGWSLVYNPPGTSHRDRFATTGGRFMSIDLDPELVPERRGAPVVVSNPDARIAAARLASLLSNQGSTELELEDCLLRVLQPVRPIDGCVALPAWLFRAAEALADCASDASVRVGEIARLVGVHPVHLARAHRRHFGCSPADALRQRRVSLAATYLEQGWELAEVAIAAGFADRSHMTRSFRREFGTTPARYRRAFL